MSKEKLVKAIESKFDSAAAAGRAVDAVTEGITALTAAGEPVSLQGFGRFEKRHRAGRNGRNLHTGETIAIPAKTVLGFTSKVAF